MQNRSTLPLLMHLPARSYPTGPATEFRPGPATRTAVSIPLKATLNS